MYHYPTTTEFAPNKSCFRIMKQLHGYFRATGKAWAHISQAWLMQSVDKYEHQPIPRSTLNYNLRILEAEGFIVRQKRHMRDKKSGQLIFRVSMYKITKRLRQFFAKLAKYYKNCGWTPTVKQMEHGHVAAVGTATTREAAFMAFLSQRRRDGLQSQKTRGQG